MAETNDDSLDMSDSLLERLRSANSLMVLTGAGVSAGSGIPTFRAPGDGLWSRYPVKDFASPEGWKRNPQLVWGWYSYRRRLARRAQPNPAHLALASLEAYYPDLTLVTQNVDGLHQRAGSRNVIELHGSLFRFKCSREETPVDWQDPDDENPEALEALERGETPPVPLCPSCGALLRPDVVWFGEMLPPDAISLATAAAEECDVCLVVGTSALVWPAAGLPRARKHGALLIEINPEQTNLTRRADLAIQEDATTALPALVRLITQAGEEKEKP